VVAQIDQAKPVLWPKLGQLGGEASQVIAAAERAMEHQCKLGRGRVTDERVGGNERHAYF
jgi:hypothetical protein